jgi:hypothetical protein
MGRIAATLRQIVASRRGSKGEGPQRPGYQAGMTEPQVTTGLSGALARATMVALAVVAPAVLVPQVAPETGQVLLLIALFAAAVVFAEYASAYPALIEFRFAAPYNRTRFALIALMAVLLSLIQRGQGLDGALPQMVAGLASVLGGLLDQPFTPVRLLLGALPAEIGLEQALLVRDGAALAMVLALLTVGGFAAAMRLNLWPMGQGPFNVWINLPTFDPTAGNDVVLRLLRQGRLNIWMGALMPALLPGVVMLTGLMAQPVDFTAPMNYVWGLTVWAFVPTALIMRGMAMTRVARMIRANRRRLAEGEGNAYAAA